MRPLNAADEDQEAWQKFDQKSERIVKHYVVRCERLESGQAWRFVLIDPQNSRKVYLKDWGALQLELSAQLNQLAVD